MKKSFITGTLEKIRPSNLIWVEDSSAIPEAETSRTVTAAEDRAEAWAPNALVPVISGR